ncbi:MAG TPA: flagellar motor switch protein FliG [Solirubrobacteraceae bacterium]|jgi:flagellar motor switch protein FliG|nr:flagellar motor switch protein FliG [Solirubrobacteraceae bacterium]
MDGPAEKSVAVVPYRTSSKFGGVAAKGADKAAVLLVSLGMDRAARVLAHMSDDEIEAAGFRMAQLAHIDSATVDAVIHEFVDRVQTSRPLASGGMEYANEVLTRALRQDLAAAMIERVSSAFEKRPFDFMRHTPAARIAKVLFDESEQTKALVIASLHASLAADVLSELSELDQADVALRVALMDDVSPEVVKMVEDTMRRKFASASEPDIPTVGGVKSLATILAHADHSTERKVLDCLTESNGELATEVRQLLFTFDDLVKLDDRAIQLVLREVDRQDLSLALRGISEDLRDRILLNMSDRGGRMMLEEIEYQRPHPKRFIEQAQGRIVAVVRRLEDAGLIVIPREGEDIV